MENKKRIMIVGGVAGGASAAARARRLSEDAEIIMFERGEHISFANCGMPYFVGGVIKEKERLLVQTPEAMKKRFRIDVRTRSEVIGIDRQARTILVRNLVDGQEEKFAYDDLILSPGAMPIRPPIKGLDPKQVFTLRNIADMDAIKNEIDLRKSKRALIIGGGYIGLEMTEAFREREVDVTLVELASQVMGMIDQEMAQPLHQQLKLHGVDLRLGVSVSEVQQQGETFVVILSDGRKVECDMVILAIGVKPEVTLAKDAGLTIGELGGIVVDDHMRTSDPHIYAVGDVVEVEHLVAGTAALIPLAGPANRQGRIAADNIFGRDSVYRKTQGTAICKVFDLAIGMTGMSEKGLKRAKMAYEKVYVHPASHAGYYPGASPLTLKLLFDPANGKVLGAQAVGSDGVDKRIDVIAVAIRAGMTVNDLKDLELCYAPPYGSAKDPVNYAGFVASNVLAGDAKICHVDDVLNLSDRQMLLDVRAQAEADTGTIPGAKVIPIDELRDRLDEVPKDKEIIAYCQVGLRGYLACRILSQKGYACRNLSGGYKTYKMVAGFKTTSDLSGGAAPEREKVRNENDLKNEKNANVVHHIDACALQCPGPIMQLKKVMETLSVGQAVTIATRDPGFVQDIKAWCQSTNNMLLAIETNNGVYQATVARGIAEGRNEASVSTGKSVGKKKTIVVFSNDFDRAMAAFVIANGAAAMGSEMTMFFTFWGINILRKATSEPVNKNLIERMFGWMMPKGPDRLSLSKMNMAGLGTRMMKNIMRKKNVASLSDLIDQAKRAGVKLVVCSMSMDLMGIHKEELIDGVEIGGVVTYLEKAESGDVNLFI
jgi:NADPH-dependent 2,4-dienoyl-CoA reductase/sulfur reductase-like enzyme/peroxiredoxin family protein/TusA-related sulfurtransferase/rhodanese-related sulfurtransferase